MAMIYNSVVQLFVEENAVVCKTLCMLNSSIKILDSWSGQQKNV